MKSLIKLSLTSLSLTFVFNKVSWQEGCSSADKYCIDFNFNYQKKIRNLYKERKMFPKSIGKTKRKWDDLFGKA